MCAWTRPLFPSATITSSVLTAQSFSWMNFPDLIECVYVRDLFRLGKPNHQRSRTRPPGCSLACLPISFAADRGFPTSGGQKYRDCKCDSFPTVPHLMLLLALHA